MPAFHLNEGEQRAVFAYLQAIDATGQGTPPAPLGERGPLFSASLARHAARDLPIPAAVADGAAVVAARSCGACHTSFAAEGVNRAPDLSLAVGHLGKDGVRRVLADGRGDMAAAHLDARDTEAVLTLLTWVGEHRAELAPSAPVALRDVPWFAYPARREAPPTAPTDTGFLVADRSERP
jgi:mono/diheme cytochrome c family protein